MSALSQHPAGSQNVLSHFRVLKRNCQGKNTRGDSGTVDHRENIIKAKSNVPPGKSQRTWGGGGVPVLKMPSHH